LACVLLSRVDNLPNSCIEAMSLGSIVIGTYGASFEQLIKNKENGLLIKRDSSKALCKAVDYLMEMSEDERSIMGGKARKTVERLEPETIYLKTIQYYQKVIDKF
jgi:glycosyltransferase involved in cell wall biosynthesis